jgi:hypothetical protein
MLAFHVREGAFRVSAHKTGEAHHISGKNDGEAAHGHSGSPASRIPAM